MIFCCCRLRKVNKPSKSLQRFVSISGLSVYLVPFLILKQLFSKVVIKTSMLSKSTLKSIFLWIKLNLSSSYTSSVNTGVKIERLLLWRPLSSMFLLFFVFFVVLVFISVSVLQYYTRGGKLLPSIITFDFACKHAETVRPWRLVRFSFVPLITAPCCNQYNYSDKMKVYRAACRGLEISGWFTAVMINYWSHDRTFVVSRRPLRSELWALQ